jgi:hypothetical protein
MPNSTPDVDSCAAMGTSANRLGVPEIVVKGLTFCLPQTLVEHLLFLNANS